MNAIVTKTKPKPLPAIDGLADTIAKLDIERAAWAKNSDAWSAGRAEHFARLIEELHILDPATVARVGIGRNGRGELSAEITPRAPAPKKRAIPAAPAAKVVKTIRSRKDASGQTIFEVVEGPAPPAPAVPVKRPAVTEGGQTLRDILGEETCEFFAKDTIERFQRAWADACEAREGSVGRVKLLVLRAMLAASLDAACLSKRIDELSKRTPEFLGPWQRDRSYRANDMVQFRSSLWIALTATTTEPPGPQWRLMVRGR